MSIGILLIAKLLVLKENNEFNFFKKDAGNAGCFQAFVASLIFTPLCPTFDEFWENILKFRIIFTFQLHHMGLQAVWCQLIDFQ